MFNSGRRGKRAPDGYGVISVNEKFNQTSYPIPIIDSWAITDGSYNPIDDTALNTAGGQTIVLYGSGFSSGATVNINGSNIGVVTVLDSGRITFTSPALSSATYTIYVSNTDGATAIYVPGLVYSGLPTWSSPAAGSIGTSYETKNVNTLSYNSFTATGDAPITYSVVSGNLPSGVTLSSSGTLSGTLPVAASPTTYSFTIRASDAQLQDSDRSYSLTINPDVVTWVTPTLNGTLTVYETQQFSTPLSATSAAGYGVMYSANTLPTGITLTSSTGAFSGYANTVGNTYATLTATANTTGRYANSSVNFVVNQDVVTWSSPANNTSYTVSKDAAITNVTLSANSAAGYGVQYSANALPTGVTLSGGTISGTPTSAGTTYTQLTATANTTGRYAYAYISWTVNISGDSYFANTVMLLSANNTLQTSSFITDSSNNNTQLTIIGDTRAQNFNPYQLGYYSNYFDGSGDSLTLTATGATFGTGDFTIECWIYRTSSATDESIFVQGVSGTSGYGLGVYSQKIRVRTPAIQDNSQLGATTISGNVWYHIALSRSGTTTRLYINGTLDLTISGDSSNESATAWNIGHYGASDYVFSGYISNLRVVKGTALYTSAFTSPTTPLTAVSGTQLLSCNTNRFNDSSVNNFTITKSGDTKVSSAHPFTTVYQAGTQYYSTKFPGTGGTSITVPDSANLHAGFAVNLTLECWIYLRNLPASYAPIVSTGAFYSGYGTVISMFIDSSGYLKVNRDVNMVVSPSTVSRNVWHHVAVTRTGYNSGALYIDGVQVSNVVDWGSIDLTGDTNPWLIGADSAAAALYGFDGYISNVRFIKSQAIFTGNFTPSTVPLTRTTIGHTGAGVAGSLTGTVQLLTCQDNTLKDNSSNAFTVSSNDTTIKQFAISPFTPNSYTNTQITTYGSGYFDGSGDYITFPGVAYNTSVDFTYEAWFYLTAAGNVYPVILKSYDGTNGIIVRFGNDGYGDKLQVMVAPGSTSNIWSCSLTQTQALNQWYHVAFVRKSGVCKLFLNGIQQSIGSGANPASYPSTSFNDTTAVGVPAAGSALIGDGFTGYISDARILNGVGLYTSNFVPQFTSPLTNVTNTQLLTLQTNGSHNNSVFKDQSSFNNLVTRSANTTNGTFSPYGDNWSYYFPSGASNNLGLGTGSAALVDIAGAYTIEGWFYMPATSGSYGIMCTSAANSGGNWKTWLFDGVNLFTFYDRAGATLKTITCSQNWPVNTWFHMAFVMDSSTTATVYLNGTSVGTTTDASTFSGTSTYLVYVGSNVGAGSSYFSGYMSNLRFSNIARYTSSFTPSTTPLVADANTKLLTCNSNAFVNQSLYATTDANRIFTSKLGTHTVQKFSPFGTVTVPKYFSTYFDSTNYLTLSSSSGLALGTGDFTIECWAYLKSGYSTYASFFTTNPPSGNSGVIMGSDVIGVYTGGGGGNSAVSVSFPTDKWVHVAMTRSGTTLRVYFDGVLQGSFSSGLDLNNTTGVIGARYTDGSYRWYGYISNMRVLKGTALYTTAFTPSTAPLTAIANTTLLTCQDNTFIDKSNSYISITASNTTTKPLLISPFTPTVDASPVVYSPTTFGGSMYFDGTGDYLRLPSEITLDNSNFTVEGWFYQTGDWTSGTYVTVFTNSNATTQFTFDGNSAGGTTDRGRVELYNGGTTTSSANTAIKRNQWNHVAWVRYNGTVAIYVNGISVASVSNSTSTKILYIGGYGASGYEFKGYMADVRITNSVALYTSNFVPGPTPLTPIAYLNNRTDLANTAQAALLLSGTSGGIIDQTRSLDLETFGDAKVTQFSPYNGSYYSVLFSGSSYFTVANNTAFDLGSGDFTIEGWICPLATNAQDYVLCGKGTSATYNPFQVNVTVGSSNVYAILYCSTSGSAWEVTASSPNAPTKLGQWYHIAAVRSGNNFTCYINGSAGTTKTASGALTVNTQAVGIGALSDGSNPTNGYWHSIRIVKGTAIVPPAGGPTSPVTAVSGTSLLTCQSNKFVDNSTNAFALTATGTSKVQTQNPFQVNSGISYYFDGAGDYLKGSNANTTNLSFGTGNFTVECWVYPTAPNQNSILIDTRPSTSEGYYFTLILNPSNAPSLYVNSTTFTTGAPLTGNTWTHLAVSRNSGTTTLYVNGTQSGPAVVDSTNYISNALMIGAYAAGTYNYNGYMTDVRITKGIARYTSNNTTYLNSGSPYMTK